MSEQASVEKLRVGVIGAGGIARSVHLPSLRDMDDVEVVAICDIIEDRAAAMAEQHCIPRVYTLYKEMLAKEELDAAFVLIEPGNLFHVAWHCLDAGVHTFMEKPPGVTLFQAESLCRKSDDTGKILQAGFNRRHIPVVREAKRLVEERTTITQVEGCFYKFGTGAFDRGSISAFASDTVHAVDLVRWIAGGSPVSVATVTGQADEPFLNRWNSVCRFDNGVTGIVKANYKTGGRVHQFQIHGPGVSAFVNLGLGAPGADAILLTHRGEVRYSLAARGADDQGVLELDGMELAGSQEFYKYYGFYFEDRHFIDCIRAGVEPETSIQDAVKSMAMMERIAQSVI